MEIWQQEADLATRIGRERSDLAWRAVRHFAGQLRAYGFLPTMHFVERFLQRARSRGKQISPRGFASLFVRARHYRQARRGYNTRIAVVGGIPVVYRLSGRSGRQRRIVLVTILPRLPPVIPTPRPGL